MAFRKSRRSSSRKRSGGSRGRSFNRSGSRRSRGGSQGSKHTVRIVIDHANTGITPNSADLPFGKVAAAPAKKAKF